MIITRDMMGKAEEVAGLLKLLSNPNRLMIICRLLEGEMSVSEIETELGIKQPTLSRELGRLRDEGIITARRQSKVVFYTFSNARMERLILAIYNATFSNEKIIAVTPPPQPISFNPRPKFNSGQTRLQKDSGYSLFPTVPKYRSS
ncbi:MAG: hypothetical protein COA43_04775 [Robiginitomaculum sp.]|nr:MAG: hypothetical protein COA43_04775 [Robiginitomaculum sp.]